MERVVKHRARNAPEGCVLVVATVVPTTTPSRRCTKTTSVIFDGGKQERRTRVGIRMAGGCVLVTTCTKITTRTVEYSNDSTLHNQTKRYGMVVTHTMLCLGPSIQRRGTVSVCHGTTRGGIVCRSIDRSRFFPIKKPIN